MLSPDQLVAKSDTEHSIQTAFFAGLALAKIHPDTKWVHAIPNGGERSAATAGKLKAEGVRKGVWDVFVPIPRQGKCGLYIEFKVPARRTHKNGGLSDEQIKFGETVHEFYRMKVCYTWREAAQALCDYLSIEYQEERWNGACIS